MIVRLPISNLLALCSGVVRRTYALSCDFRRESKHSFFAPTPPWNGFYRKCQMKIVRIIFNFPMIKTALAWRTDSRHWPHVPVGHAIFVFDTQCKNTRSINTTNTLISCVYERTNWSTTQQLMLDESNNKLSNFIPGKEKQIIMTPHQTQSDALFVMFILIWKSIVLKRRIGRHIWLIGARKLLCFLISKAILCRIWQLEIYALTMVRFVLDLLQLDLSLNTRTHYTM